MSLQEAQTCLSFCMQCKLLRLCRLATADLDWEEGVMPPKVTLQGNLHLLSLYQKPVVAFRPTQIKSTGDCSNTS